MRIFLNTICIILIGFGLNSQSIVYPKEFPRNLIGNKFCGTASTTGSMYGGSTAYLDLPFELYISKDEGIYVRYNPREKFGEYDWGTTQKITSFKLYKSVPTSDRYGNVLGITYYYQVPMSLSKHAINEISVYDFYGSELAPPARSISVEINVPSYKNATINTYYRGVNVCGSLKTAEELKEETLAKEKANYEKEQHDIKKYSSILQLINNDNYAEAKSEVHKLNFPGKFPYLIELHKKEDVFLKTQIKNLLAEEKIDEAIQRYDALNLQETKNELKSEMQLALSGFYKAFEQSFDNNQISKIINENKVPLAKLSPGYHKITSDSEGNLSVDGVPIGTKTSPLTKLLGRNHQFSANTAGGGEINIEQKIANEGREQMLVSTKKTIYQLGFKGYFKKGFLKNSLEHYHTASRFYDVIYDSSIKKNRYRIMQPQLVRIYANGYEISVKKRNEFIAEEKFKSRAVVVIIRSIILFGGIGVTVAAIVLN
jgi:hypothetical protein